MLFSTNAASYDRTMTLTALIFFDLSWLTISVIQSKGVFLTALVSRLPAYRIIFGNVGQLPPQPCYRHTESISVGCKPRAHCGYTSAWSQKNRKFRECSFRARDLNCRSSSRLLQRTRKKQYNREVKNKGVHSIIRSARFIHICFPRYLSLDGSSKVVATL